MLSKFVIRNQIVANAVQRIYWLFNEGGKIRYFADGLIFNTGFNTNQVLQVRNPRILEDSQIEKFLGQLRIFPGLQISEEVVNYLNSLSLEEREEVLRNLLVEAIDLKMDTYLLSAYHVACRRVFSNPNQWTNIPDIKKPFTTRVVAQK